MQETPPVSPLASVSEPDDLLCLSGYFLAVVFVAPCWLRVILRPEEKTDAATAAAAADSAAESRPSSGPAAAGELLRTELQLSRREKRVLHTKPKKMHLKYPALYHLIRLPKTLIH